MTVFYLNTLCITISDIKAEETQSDIANNENENQYVEENPNQYVNYYGYPQGKVFLQCTKISKWA